MTVQRLSWTLLFLAGILACSSSSTDDAGGCKKDTDCAAGRICNASGRCEGAASSTTTNPADGGRATTDGASASGPSQEQLSCRQWRESRQGCDCKCGTSCLDFNDTRFCGHSCSSTTECNAYMASTFGPGYPFTVRCEDDFCVFSDVDAGP
jgi:hypothetical protein